MNTPDPFTVTVERKDGNRCEYTVTKFPWHWKGYTVIDQPGCELLYLPTTDVESVTGGIA